MMNDWHILFILKAMTHIEFITYIWRDISNWTIIYGSSKARNFYHIVCVMIACFNAAGNMAWADKLFCCCGIIWRLSRPHTHLVPHYKFAEEKRSRVNTITFIKTKGKLQLKQHHPSRPLVDLIDPSLDKENKKVLSMIKHIKNDSSGVGPLKVDCKLISDSKEKANILNGQLKTVFNEQNHQRFIWYGTQSLWSHAKLYHHCAWGHQINKITQSSQGSQSSCRRWWYSTKIII